MSLTVVSLSISRSIRYFAQFSFQKSQLIHCTTVEWQFLFAFFSNLRHTVVSLSISRSRRGYVPHHHCPSSMTGNWYIVAPKETINEPQRATLYSKLPIVPKQHGAKKSLFFAKKVHFKGKIDTFLKIMLLFFWHCNVK